MNVHSVAQASPPAAAGPATRPGVTEPSGGASGPLRRLAPGALALVLYAGVAVALLSGGLFTGHGTVVGLHGDTAIFIWNLEWVPFALAHQLNPLVSYYEHYPSGANLMWNTSIIFPALVLAPITKLFGPIVSYNVLTVLGVALSAWFAFLAIRRYSRGFVPPAAGGLLYGFSPYMVAQTLGHAQLFIAVFPPLLVLFADEILVRQRRPPLFLGVILGFAAAAQLLTGEELLAMTAIMAIPVGVALAVLHRDQLRPRLRFAFRAAAAASLTFAVLAAYPLYIQFFGPQRIHGVLQGRDIYIASPRAFLAPTSLQLLGLFGRVTSLDSNVYIGVPLFALAIFTVIWLRRRHAVLVAAVVLISAMVLSLGGHLNLDGTLTRTPLPWVLFNHLPVVANILPIRMMVFGYLALGMLVACFLSEILRRRLYAKLLGVAAVACALAPLIPLLPYPTGQYLVPQFFSDGSATGLSASGSVLVSPYIANDPAVWQAVAGIEYRSQLGLVFTPGPGGHVWGGDLDPLGQEVRDLGDYGLPAPSVIPPAMRQEFIRDLVAHDVHGVIVGPSIGEAQVVHLFTDLIGRTGQSIGGVVVWFNIEPIALG
jgi:hypothetical protein